MDQSQYDAIMRQHHRGCVFCNPHPALSLYENDYFRVCFDPAPLTPGHLIVHSKTHVGCAAEVEVAELPALMAARGWALDRVRSRFGPATFYEHGRAGHCLAGRLEERLCHHFHLHCLPGDFDLRPELNPRFQALELSRYDEIAETYEQYGDYLYVEPPSAPATYFVADDSVEPHLLRTLIAARIGDSTRADWGTYKSPALLAASMERLGAPVATGTST